MFYSKLFDERKMRTQLKNYLNSNGDLPKEIATKIPKNKLEQAKADKTPKKKLFHTITILPSSQTDFPAVSTYTFIAYYFIKFRGTSRQKLTTVYRINKCRLWQT